jgi:hypothetical protein
LVVKFKIGGSLRFLSHAETLRVLQRACVRAGINLQYSRGFNPRPKMSLPLPRPVGVESDDELLTLRAYKSTGAQGHKGTGETQGDQGIRAKGLKGIGAQEQKSTREQGLKSVGDIYDLCTYDFCTCIQANLSEQLPQGFELISVNFAEARTPYQPRSVNYVFSVRPEFLDEQLKDRINDLMASENLFIRRTVDERKSNFKDMDVRDFLGSIEIEGANIVVECEVSAAGSIRVQEVLELLELDETMLASPTRRTKVKWRDE